MTIVGNNNKLNSSKATTWSSKCPQVWKKSLCKKSKPQIKTFKISSSKKQICKHDDRVIHSPRKSFLHKTKHHSIYSLKKMSNKINYLKLCYFILAIIFFSIEQKIQVPDKYLYVELWSYAFDFHKNSWLSRWLTCHVSMPKCSWIFSMSLIRS